MESCEGKIQIFQLWAKEGGQLGNPSVIVPMLVSVARFIGMDSLRRSEISFKPLYIIGGSGSGYMVFHHLPGLQPAYANLIINATRDYESSLAMQVIAQHIDLLAYEVERPLFYSGMPSPYAFANVGMEFAVSPAGIMYREG